MATLRNQRKLAALITEKCEEHSKSNLAQTSDVPRSQKDYNTEVFQKIEGKVTKTLSQDFSRTERRILGALCFLDDIFLIPLFQEHSGTASETSRNTLRTNQGTNEGNSLSDPHSEAGVSQSQRLQKTLDQMTLMTKAF